MCVWNSSKAADHIHVGVRTRTVYTGESTEAGDLVRKLSHLTRLS
jgi:hypothetical protein